MKKYVAMFCLLLCSTIGQAKDKPVPADYTIKVHISASSIPNLYSNGWVMSAETTLNSRKIELSGYVVRLNDLGQKSGSANNDMLIAPGDYQARLIKDVHNSDSTAIHQEYDILLTDGIIWHCITTGISE